MEEIYTKYNNLDFERFNMDRILDAMEDSQGFILSTVFQKKFSLDVNLKRHEDMKNWILAKGLPFVVLDGVQKVVDRENDKIYDYSILYLLLFYHPDKMDPSDFSELGQVILKRYDINSVIIKQPHLKDLESWNREMEKKAFKNITSNNMFEMLTQFFAGLNKKRDKFYFLGIEKQNFKTRAPFYRPIPKRTVREREIRRVVA